MQASLIDNEPITHSKASHNLLSKFLYFFTHTYC
jgi:hypothetical protein